MSKDPEKDFVPVNQILGKQASIGFIPTSQILPWIGITIISYILTNGFFSLGMPWFLGTTLWLIVTWWLLTGNKPHLFLDKFRRPPGQDWCNGNLLYLSLFPQQRPTHLRRRVKDCDVQVKLPPLNRRDQQGRRRNYMPFQNELDLISIATITKDERTCAAYLLNKGKQWQLVFGFQTQGLHNLLTPEEITNTAIALEEGLKDLPPGEKLTIHTGCYSRDRFRQQQLSQLADSCQLTPISVLLRNEQKRVQELTLQGTRQTWQQMMFCTWTFNEKTGSKSSDPIGKTINFLTELSQKRFRQFTGTEELQRERFFKQLLFRAFEEGFLGWELLLNTKLGLETRPCKADELWQWLWNKFNAESSVVPTLPNQLIFSETSTGYSLTPIIHSTKDIKTVLIEGMQGRSSCPEHRGSGDTLWLMGRNQQCGVLTLEEKPKGWQNTREQLRALWKVMSNSYIYDTEAIVEISPASNTLIADNLSRQAKQSRSASVRAVTKGQGRDAGAEVKAEESLEAQKKLYKGAKGINTAVTFLVYRPQTRQLDLACRTLANSFGSAKVLRERHIAWAIWLETLPITMSWLLHTSSLLSERRHIFDTEELPGVLPLTVTRSLDTQGVELISTGGNPTVIDLFHQQITRALITGESGSGKSVLAWRFIVDALAANIPVVGIDISSGSGSTFKTAVELLGDNGAYYDVMRYSSNLLEPPDLRRFPPQERESRLAQWKEFIRCALTVIAMGKVNDPQLSQRVDNLLLQTLERFLGDSDIIERYNVAFEKGWKSLEWQQIPTLNDFLKFCSKEQLNLQHFSELDSRAINQIHSQIKALLLSPLGKSLGKPSSFSPEPAIKFFALNGQANEQDLYLMALNAQAACLRNALASPKSLFVGDEMSVLFKKDGIAQAVGELFAIGRKNGIACLLIAQDINSIVNCQAGAQILQNTVYRLTGALTANGASAWTKLVGYPAAIINQNATESFRPSRSELASKWLVEKNGRFWQCYFYPGEMTLATVANNQDEIEARQAILSQYPTTQKGQLLGLRQFTDEYVRALQQSESILEIAKKYNANPPSQLIAS